MAMAMVSSSSATVAVDKATSDLLIGPDWTMNIDICDSLNSNPSLAKDVMKAVKKRMQHKNPKVQLLALTLLETMVKNCGDYVHFQIVEKHILAEMIKIVKKKTDMHVRDKILVLLDSWQEAFGGPGGKYPLYYWTYEELRRSGVEFPRRSPDAAPIFTPPVTHPALRHSQAGYGMPSNSSRTLDEAMASEIEGLSLSILDSMRNAMELLNDMLQAVNPGDREAVKDEVIVDLVNSCRSNQKKLMQMLTTTGDEELLGQGLELNDSLQMLLAKHDAIATGSPMPTQITNLSPKPSDGRSSTVKPSEVRDCSPSHSTTPTEPVANVARSQIDEEEDEEDDFAQLARRHSRVQSSQSTNGTSGALVPMDANNASSSHVPCNALALTDPPAPVRTTKEQDMIDLLSITLSTVSTSPNPQMPPSSSQNMSQIPASPSTQGYPPISQTYPGVQSQVPYNSYVVPWAQPQPQHQSQGSSQPQLQPQHHDQLQFQYQPQIQPLQQSWPHPQTQPQHQPQPQSQPQHQPQLPLQQWPPQSQPQSQPQQQWSPQSQTQPQPQVQPQRQPQLRSQYPQFSSGYPPPPWAATPGYANGHMSTTNNMFLTPMASTTSSSTPMQASRPLQHHNSFPSRGINGSSMNGDPRASSNPRSPAPLGQKPFIPSYRLFEDLNVLGNVDGRLKMASGTSPSLSGSSGQSMVGGRK